MTQRGWFWHHDYGDGKFHVVPVDEVDDHAATDCRCQPEVDQESGAIVHNAYDGRQDFETGKRIPS